MIKIKKILKNHFFRDISGSGDRKFFFENRSPSHFGYYHFAPLCQNSENSYGLIPRKAGNEQTNRD